MYVYNCVKQKCNCNVLKILQIFFLIMTKSSGSGNPITNLEKAINDFLSSGSLKAAVFRANDIFSFGTKVLAALAFTAFLSTTFLHNTTTPHITTRSVLYSGPTSKHS